MSLALLVAAALAGTLALPPEEDPALWADAARALGVELGNAAPEVSLVHDAAGWRLVRGEQVVALPAPDSPAWRVGVLEESARLFGGSGGAGPEGVAAAPEVLPVARPAARALPAPVGAVVGLVPGGALFGDDPHPTLSVSGGYRAKNGLAALLVVEAGLPAALGDTSFTAEHDSVRAEFGFRYVALGLGLGRAELTQDEVLRGELLFPVATLEAEVPLRAGPLWLWPRVGVRMEVADVTIRSSEHPLHPVPMTLLVGLGVERELGGRR